MTNTGIANAPLVDVCGDNDDNDGNGEVDDVNGNVATEPGKPCDNGKSGSCLRTGHYVCDGLFATKCDAPIPAQTSCGGCTTLAQEPNTSCDTGQVVPGGCKVPGLAECDGLDAVRCAPQPPPPPNECGGCVPLAHTPGTSCPTGLKGECAAPGTWTCNSGGNDVTCTPSVTPVAEICDGKDNDCNGRFDEGCPMDVGYLLIGWNWSPWFGPGDVDQNGFSGSFMGALCPNYADGETFPSGLSTHSGSLVDKIDGENCSKIALNSNESVVPYQYSISWTSDVFTIPGHVGGPGGGSVITNCEPPGLMSGIRGRYNGSELVSLEVQCAQLSLENATMTEVGRYWAGAVGGSSGTFFSFECAPGQYVAYFEAIGTDEIPGDGPDDGFVKNVRIGCNGIGVRYR